MANNPYVNKVQTADGTTLMDVTDTTATASDVASGSVFYTASGARTVGTGTLNFIDDTAGTGDTDKTWSADKLVDEFAANDPGNTHVWVGTCDTAAATQDKAVTINGVTQYTTGDIFVITFTYAQNYDGCPRLNVNGLGAMSIKRWVGSDAEQYQWRAGETLIMVYNASTMLAVNQGIAMTTSYGLTKLLESSISTSTFLALTPSALNYFSLFMVTGAPVYSATSTYSVGDRVRYSWFLYECNTAITTPEEFNSTHWTQLPPIQTQIDSIEDNIGNVVGFDLQTQIQILDQKIRTGFTWGNIAGVS